MLNKKGERELCYLAKVTKIEPIEGYDKVELAYVNGWTNIVPKGAFQEGDYGVFFEVDSKVPEEEPFKFLEKRHYKIKVQKMCKRILSVMQKVSCSALAGWSSGTFNAVKLQ